MRLLCLLLLGAFGVVVADDAGITTCYFSSWARYRPDDGMFDVDNIDPFLCTHLIFAFTGLSNQTWEMEVLDPWNELCTDEPGGHYCAFKRFVELKQYNPDLKVIIAIGGWNEGSEDYSIMAADPVKRATFITSVTTFLYKYQFDGLDLDWEYPSARGGVPEDRENYVILSRELRNEFDQSNPPYLLTGAFSAGKNTIDDAYDIPALIESYDFFHIMAYDYHGAFENFTHHNSPLCSHPEDYDHDLYQYYNVMYTLDYYLSIGLPREKMLLGTPTYGRCYTLDNYNDNGFWASASKPGPAGPYIRIQGTLGSNEICERLQDDKSCTIVRDPLMHEPYFYCMSDNIWCGYDDADSLRIKARQAKNKGLAGIMVWQIDTDDFIPNCYEESFHLIKTMKRAFAEPAGSDVVVCDPWTTRQPSTLTTTVTTKTPEPTTVTTTEPIIITSEPTTATQEPATTTTPQPKTTTIPTTPEPPTTIIPTTPESPTTFIPTTPESPTTIIPSTPEPLTTIIPSTPEPPTTIIPSTPEPPTTIIPTTSQPTATTPIPTTTEPIIITSEPTTATQEPASTTTPQPSTTTSGPTTSKPTTTTSSPTTATPERTTATPESTTTVSQTTPMITTIPVETTTDGGDYGRPNCTNHPDGTTYRHYDCNKYWECINDYAYLMPCGPGTLFDENLKICNWEDQVDTSQCRVWACTVDNTYYPAVDCDKYYRCYNGAGHLEVCPAEQYWNQNIILCDFKERVDTSACNIP